MVYHHRCFLSHFSAAKTIKNLENISVNIDNTSLLTKPEMPIIILVKNVNVYNAIQASKDFAPHRVSSSDLLRLVNTDSYTIKGNPALFDDLICE
jgi:hypothetical protein